MKTKDGYATYAIYEVLTADMAGEKKDVIGGQIEEVIGKEAAEKRLEEITKSGKRAVLKYVAGVEDPAALSRRTW